MDSLCFFIFFWDVEFDLLNFDIVGFGEFLFVLLGMYGFVVDYDFGWYGVVILVVCEGVVEFVCGDIVMEGF